MTILDEIATFAKQRVSFAQMKISAEDIKARALELPRGNFDFETALKSGDIAFICECKKASPSKGLIASDFPYLQITKGYERAGANAISVLTEPKWFLGSDDYLAEVASAVSIPCLRKDFTVDDYMIYEAKLLGASAVLLICSILSKQQIADYIELCDALGMSALVEAHDDEEVRVALEAGARIIGVNNRNLNDFTVDTENSKRLRELVPTDELFVAESGIKTAEDVAAMRNVGADAVLVGETLMTAEDKAAKLLELRGKEIPCFSNSNLNAVSPSYYDDSSTQNLTSMDESEEGF